MKTLVTGGTGMVGKALEKLYANETDAVFIGTADADLRSFAQTEDIFAIYKPECVIHLAARVGGVKGNSTYVADFFEDNLFINNNVLSCARKYGAKKVVSLLSTCVFPDADFVRYPLTEDQLHLGPPHDSNYGYAYAKRMIEVQSRAYNQQYPDQTKYVCAIPNNLYGNHDNFDLENGHVIPSLIRKIYEASKFDGNVSLWGSPDTEREFTHVRDIAKALKFMANNDVSSVLNIGTSESITIGKLTQHICEYFGFKYENVKWGTGPAGQFRKPSDNGKFLHEYYQAELKAFQYMPIKEGVEKTCAWFENVYPQVRGVKNE